MTDEEFYGQALDALRTAEQYLKDMIAGYQAELDQKLAFNLIVNCQSRRTQKVHNPVWFFQRHFSVTAYTGIQNERRKQLWQEMKSRVSVMN